MKRTLLLFTMAICSLGLFAQDTSLVKLPVKVSYPTGYTAKIDLEYTKVKDWIGRLDLYLPPKENGLSPLVINIHGGGWNHGSKEEQTGFSAFFKKGYVVANVEYRLVQVAPAPAAIEDIRCALIYLITNAKELNIDVNRIVIMGGSAGAHLALMGGLLENDHRFDGNCKTNKTIKVAAIINQYAIADVWDWAYGPNIKSKSAVNWLGPKAKDMDFGASVSPITYVKKSSPPTFIVHGDADPVVPFQQSQMLYQKFIDSGVKTQFVTVAGGLHGKFTAEQKKDITIQMMDFLKKLNIHQ